MKQTWASNRENVELNLGHGGLPFELFRLVLTPAVQLQTTAQQTHLNR